MSNEYTENSIEFLGFAKLTRYVHGKKQYLRRLLIRSTFYPKTIFSEENVYLWNLNILLLYIESSFFSIKEIIIVCKMATINQPSLRKKHFFLKTNTKNRHLQTRVLPCFKRTTFRVALISLYRLLLSIAVLTFSSNLKIYEWYPGNQSEFKRFQVNGKCHFNL